MHTGTVPWNGSVNGVLGMGVSEKSTWSMWERRTLSTVLFFFIVSFAIYRNLVIFRIENISYVIISCSFNFVRSPYHI